MEFHKITALAVLMLTILLGLNAPTVDACSCMPSHPQTHYCLSDYAVLVRVLRKSTKIMTDKVVYKVEVKKSYKMNHAGQKQLKNGRLLTADSSSMCGISLDIGRLYVIAARAGPLHICSYIKEYKKMSTVERRGFTGSYAKSCNCTVQPCFGNQCLTNRETETGCKWSPFAKCETQYSACMPVTYRTPEGIVSKCHWRRTPAYKHCMSDP